MDPLACDGHPWTVKEDALLGTDTDRAIAAKLKRSSVSVSNRRTKLGIPRRATNRPAVPHAALMESDGKGANDVRA